ncbi:hypothetical protein, partial [Escherichia coli]|uniref:hypothetical protein n=1 Tax=Escherichia coli TaxID=562 RepID=UPI00193B129F
VFPHRHADAVNCEALADSEPTAHEAPTVAGNACEAAPTSRQDACRTQCDPLSLPFGEFSWQKHPCASQ